MEKNSKGFSTIGFLAGLLTIAFVVLKLCHVIEWSWIWVLAPIWIYVGVVVLIVLIVIIWALIEENR